MDGSRPDVHLVDPEHSAVTYVPRTPELALVAGVALVHGRDVGVQLDVSPFGDPELVAVDGSTLSPDGGAVAFSSGDVRYEIRSAAPADRVLFAAMADLASGARRMSHDGTDRIEVVFEHGRLESLWVGRFEQGDPDAYFSVVFRNGETFFVRGAPHERLRLDALAMNGRVLVATAGERTESYELDAEPFLRDLLGALLAAG